MIKLRNIIDTWNMIEKYSIQGYVVEDSTTISIPQEEFERLLNSVVNKQYILKLRRR